MSRRQNQLLTDIATEPSSLETLDQPYLSWLQSVLASFIVMRIIQVCSVDRLISTTKSESLFMRYKFVASLIALVKIVLFHA